MTVLELLKTHNKLCLSLGLGDDDTCCIKVSRDIGTGSMGWVNVFDMTIIGESRTGWPFKQQCRQQRDTISKLKTFFKKHNIKYKELNSGLIYRTPMIYRKRFIIRFKDSVTQK